MSLVFEPVYLDRAREGADPADRSRAGLQILHALTDYASSGKGQIKKLKGSGDLRLRVGDYRVRFEVVEEDSYRILGVRHRKEAYRS